MGTTAVIKTLIYNLKELQNEQRVIKEINQNIVNMT